MELLTSQNKYYREFLQSRKLTLSEEIAQKQLELTEIDTALRDLDYTFLNKTTNNYADDEIVVLPNGYIPKWPYPSKIRFILELKKKPLTARQITDILIGDLEADTWRDKTKKERDKLYSTISSTLTNNSKEGKDFSKSKNEIGENIYDISVK